MHKIEDAPLHYMSSTSSFTSNLASLDTASEFSNSYHFGKSRMAATTETRYVGDFYHKKITRNTFISTVQDSALAPSCLSNIGHDHSTSNNKGDTHISHDTHNSQIFTSEKVMSCKKRSRGCAQNEAQIDVFVDSSDDSFKIGSNTNTNSHTNMKSTHSTQSALTSQIRLEQGQLGLGQACDILEDFMLPVLNDSDDCTNTGTSNGNCNISLNNKDLHGDANQDHDQCITYVNNNDKNDNTMDNNNCMKNALEELNGCDSASDCDCDSDDGMQNQLRNSLHSLISLASINSVTGMNNIANNNTGGVTGSVSRGSSQGIGLGLGLELELNNNNTDEYGNECGSDDDSVDSNDSWTDHWF